MKFVLAMLGCMAAAISVSGQGFSVQLVLEQDQYLAGETLPAKVRVSNFSGQKLRLGTEADWLTLTVENAQHMDVRRQGTPPVIGEFFLEPSMTGTKKVDLEPYFDLSRAGRYYVTAIVYVAGLKQSLQSKPVPFDIINGSSIWDQDFGVPGTVQADGTPELRHYALIETLHSKTVQLYFRLTDYRQNRVFSVFPLGTMASFGRPEPQLDQFSNLHVLFQTSARLFVHCLVNPDGVMLARESYEFTNTRPGLRAEKNGRVTVAGGARRIMPTDLPPPIPTPTPNAKPDTK